MSTGLKALIDSALRVRPGERLAYVHDEHFRALAEPIQRHCAALGVECRSLEIAYDGIEPIPAEVERLLLGAEYTVFIFGCMHNIWHAPQRKEAKYRLGKRLASIVCAPDEFYPGGRQQSHSCVSRIVNELFPVMAPGAAVRVTTAAGSDFQSVVEKPFGEDGRYDLPGTGGDFPFGEVGFGPKPGSVNGTIVYDVKVQHVGVLRTPLALKVREDRVVDVQGEHAEELRRLFERRGRILEYVSEISIGVNPFVGVSHQSGYIPEEKTYGTLHCGHGGNASYGNRKGPHIDGVMASPIVQINGTTLVLEGRLVPTYLSPDLSIWLSSNFDESTTS